MRTSRNRLRCRWGDTSSRRSAWDGGSSSPAADGGDYRSGVRPSSATGCAYGGIAASAFPHDRTHQFKKDRLSRGGKPARAKPVKARRALTGRSRSEAEAQQELDDPAAWIARARHRDVAIGACASGRRSRRCPPVLTSLPRRPTGSWASSPGSAPARGSPGPCCLRRCASSWPGSRRTAPATDRTGRCGSRACRARSAVRCRACERSRFFSV